MVTQNFALNLSNILISPSNEAKAWSGGEKTSCKLFKDVFADAAEKIQSDNKATGSDKTAAQKQNFKTFRDADSSRRMEAATNKSYDGNRVINCREERSKVESSRDDKNMDTKAGMVMETLAGILGINLQELAKLLQKLDIKPEELADISKAEETAGKIAKPLSLDDGESKTLAGIIHLIDRQLVLKTAKASANLEVPVDQTGETLNGNMEADTTPVKSVKPGETNAGASDETAFIEQIMDKLKAVIKDITVKSQDNPQIFFEEMSNKIKVILEQNGQKPENADIEPVEADSADGRQTGFEVKAEGMDQAGTQPSDADKDETGKTPVAKSNDRETASGEETAKPVDNRDTGVKTTENDDNQQLNVLNQLKNESRIGSSLKVNKEVPVNRNEIINQVVEKAKVLSNGEKSEMVVELKPDSLGKLSLKVVTERGMVMARFIAENQQVKEIIESNMQLLKDALEKQGLTVQGFSVSVGQNSGNGFHYNEGFEENGRYMENSRIATVSGLDGIPADKANIIQNSVNPYDWNTSRINLTA